MIAWISAQPMVFKIVLAGLGSVLLLFSLWLLWRLWLRKYLEWQNIRTLEIKERVGLKTEFIKTAAQVLGGLFFLVTIYVAWANLEVSQEKYKTDLFVQAIKQLGDEKLEVRLGGIYALERIARDSEKDHGPIMEVLTAFVRLHAPWPPKAPIAAKDQQDTIKKPAPGVIKPETTAAPKVKPRPDIQAILTVLGRRVRTYGKGESHPLDLRHIDLRGADLQKAHLERANLLRTHLEGANLWSASLEGADLGLAHLEGAHLEGAHLERALLMGAHLEGTFLVGAHLEGAHLDEAHMERAVLWNAHLGGTILKGAKGLTKEQIDSAIIDAKTKLPDYLQKVDPDKAKPQ